MGFVLELQFDPSSERFIKSLMQQLKDRGLPSNLLEKSVSPHLTLLSSETLLELDTLEKLAELLESQKAFSLSAVSLGTFANEQGVLFLGAVMNQDLLNFHQSVYTCLTNDGYELSSYYMPGCWVPHITLAAKFTREQLAQAFEKLELNLPAEMVVSRLALVKYPAPVERLQTWQFNTP